MANSKRIVSYLLVMALLSVSLLSSTQTANAGSDYGAAEWATHYLKVAGEVAAAVALQKLTTTILNKVKDSGPNGTAGFIQNWVNFTTNSQYQGEGIFRAELGKANLCSYFGSNLKSLFGANGPTVNILDQNTRTNNLDPFSVRANCTMPSNFNITNYQDDFAGNGGWNAFSRMLEPQNNYYGSFFNSLSEVSAQRALSERSNANKSIANQGFYGFGEKDCKLRVANNCLIPGDIKTPGSTIDKSVANALDSPAKSLSGSKSDIIATTAISTLTTWVVNKLFDTGLAGSSADPADNGTIPSPERTADSYKQEFCMAEDNISKDAGSWIKDNYPQAWSKYPVEQPSCNGALRLFGLGGYSRSACGKSYCEQVREDFDKNSYPYSRCTESCVNDLRGKPGVALPPATFNPGTFPTTGGGFVDCDDPPNTISPNPMSIMEQVKAEFPEINLTQEGPGSGTRDEFTAIVAWRLHQGDSNWGRKRASGPQSTDTLGYLRPDMGPGRFEAVDLLSGSTGSLQRGCYGVVDSGQTWIQPSPAP